jgi:hypothetical protein
VVNSQRETADACGRVVRRSSVSPCDRWSQWSSNLLTTIGPPRREPVWDFIRDHDTGNRVVRSLHGVEARLCDAFVALANDPFLVQSITLYDWILRAESILCV